MKDGLNNYTFVIPARKDSKGIPFKNRKLIATILKSIPEKYKDKIVIATNDEFIKENYNQYRIFNRCEENAQDISSTKSLMLEMKDTISTDKIIMLYTTYPERTYDDIKQAVKFYESNNASSLLCKKQLKVSPFLMMYKDGLKGKQIIEHDLYRRQDYPECFEISHFVCIFCKKELDKLNSNLYNKDTIFYHIDYKIDIDTLNDLEKYNEKN